MHEHPLIGMTWYYRMHDRTGTIHPSQTLSNTEAVAKMEARHVWESPHLDGFNLERSHPQVIAHFGRFAYLLYGIDGSSDSPGQIAFRVGAASGLHLAREVYYSEDIIPESILFPSGAVAEKQTTSNKSPRAALASICDNGIDVIGPMRRICRVCYILITSFHIYKGPDIPSRA